MTSEQNLLLHAYNSASIVNLLLVNTPLLINLLEVELLLLENIN